MAGDTQGACEAPIQRPESEGRSRPPTTGLQPFSAANAASTSLLASRILALAKLSDLLAPAPTQSGLGWAPPLRPPSHIRSEALIMFCLAL